MIKTSVSERNEKKERKKEEMPSHKPEDECHLISQVTAVFNTLMNLADKKNMSENHTRSLSRANNRGTDCK